MRCILLKELIMKKDLLSLILGIAIGAFGHFAIPNLFTTKEKLLARDKAIEKIMQLEQTTGGNTASEKMIQMFKTNLQNQW